MRTVTYARPASRKEGGHFSFLQIPYVDVCDKKKREETRIFLLKLQIFWVPARPPTLTFKKATKWKEIKKKFNDLFCHFGK